MGLSSQFLNISETMNPFLRLFFIACSIIFFHALCNGASDTQEIHTSSISDKPPNVLVILADQLRANSLGYAKLENVKTPNIDSLERISVNFANAVSVNPVCTPYRASFMTGQYPSDNGIYFNDVRLPYDAPSIGKVFRKGDKCAKKDSAAQESNSISFVVECFVRDEIEEVDAERNKEK